MENLIPCKNKGNKRDSSVVINVEDSDFHNVIIIDNPDSKCDYSGNDVMDNKGTHPSHIIDVDESGENIISESSDLHSDATSKMVSSSGNSHSSRNFMDDECEITSHKRKPFAPSKHKGIDRNLFDFNFVYKNSSSDNDLDSEIMEGPFGKIHEQWEKAARRKGKRENCQDGHSFENHTSVSDSHDGSEIPSARQNKVKITQKQSSCYMGDNSRNTPTTSSSIDEREDLSNCVSTSDGIVEDLLSKYYNSTEDNQCKPVFGNHECLFSDGILRDREFVHNSQSVDEKEVLFATDPSFKSQKQHNMQSIHCKSKFQNNETPRFGQAQDGSSADNDVAYFREKHEPVVGKSSLDRDWLKTPVRHDCCSFQDNSNTNSHEAFFNASSCEKNSSTKDSCENSQIYFDEVLFTQTSHKNLQQKVQGTLKENDFPNSAKINMPSWGETPVSLKESHFDDQGKNPCSMQVQKATSATLKLSSEKGYDFANFHHNLIDEREKLKETDLYKQIEEEEWARRERELKIQSEEAQRLKKRKKAENLRLLDMERRQKQRVEEIRELQKKGEETLSLKEQIRNQITKELDKLAIICGDMASLLRNLGIHVEGGAYPLAHEVHAAYKQALFRFHPDRTTQSDIRQQVEAEEKFKLISRLKEKLLPS